MNPYNILMVDDELINLNALERTLRREYNVFSATNGEDALTIMEQNDIALIIADHRMPGMTGVELLEETLRKYPNTIRIILTGYSDQELLMDAVNKVHAHGFLDKPWEPEEIKFTVRNWIEARKTLEKLEETASYPREQTERNDQQLDEKDKQIKNLQKERVIQLIEKDKEAEELPKGYSKEAVEKLEETVSYLKEQIERKDQQLEEKDKQIENLQKQIIEKDEEAEELPKGYSKKAVEKLEETAGYLKEQTERKDQQLGEKDKQIENLQRQIMEKDKAVEEARQRTDIFIMQLTRQAEQSQRLLEYHQAPWWRKWFGKGRADRETEEVG